MSADAQAGGAARIGDRLRDWTKWRGLTHRLVQAVPVVMIFELACLTPHEYESAYCTQRTPRRPALI